MTNSTSTVLLFTCLSVACSSGPSVDIVGDPPAEQSAEIADAVCELEAECGRVSISCSYDPETFEVEDCSGEIVPAEYQVCYDELEPDIREALERCGLSPEEEQLVEDCVNAVLDLPCVTQEDLDAYVQEIESGNEDAQLREQPAACEAAFAVIDDC